MKHVLLFCIVFSCVLALPALAQGDSDYLYESDRLAAAMTNGYIRQGGEGEFGVYRNWMYYLTNLERRSLIDWTDDISTVVQGAVVDSAFLYLSLDNNASPGDIAFFRVTTAWTPDTTVTKWSATYPWTTDGGDFEASSSSDTVSTTGLPTVTADVLVMNVTPIIQDWKNGEAQYGMIGFDIPRDGWCQVLHYTVDHGVQALRPMLQVYSSDAPPSGVVGSATFGKKDRAFTGKFGGQKEKR